MRIASCFAAPFALLTLVLGCSSAPHPSPTAASHSAVAIGDAIVADATLADALRAEGLGGTVAFYVEGANAIRCSDVDDCPVRSAPASTFKIANSMLALERGVAPDLDFALPWDGTPSVVAECEHEVTMRDAFRASCVPYYQEIARRLGLGPMREGVARLGYGNAQIGDTVDRFWLDGPLAISPVEQIRFLSRFATGALPLTERTTELVRELMIREVRGDAVFRGKTGWAHPNTPDERGWFVGFVERGQSRAYVAVRATRAAGVPDERFVPGRVAVAVRVLESNGIF
jgi:beta-lactamase class D